MATRRSFWGVINDMRDGILRLGNLTIDASGVTTAKTITTPDEAGEMFVGTAGSAEVFKSGAFVDNAVVAGDGTAGAIQKRLVVIDDLGGTTFGVGTSITPEAAATATTMVWKEATANGTNKITEAPPTAMSADFVHTKAPVTGTPAVFATTPGAADLVLLSNDAVGGAKPSTVTNTVLLGYGTQITALGAENTDGQVFLCPEDFGVLGGAWTIAGGVNSIPCLSRTAANTTDDIVGNIRLPTRTTASKGRKITSGRVVYDANTALADDVTVLLLKTTTPADNAAIAAATSIPITFDEAHDTAAERADNTGAPEPHTLSFTVDTPAYIANGECWRLLFRVDGEAGAAAAVRFYMAEINFSETLVDQS